jgi:hypothetical protein
MSLMIGVGPFPRALLLDIVDKHERLFVAPLDRPGPHQRDEIMLGLEQRTTGSTVALTLDLPRVAAIVQWFNREPGRPGFSRLLTLDTASCAAYRDMVTLLRTPEDMPDIPELLISIEHWTGGVVRKNREATLVRGQIAQFYDWLRAFWFDGLPGVPRRRPDESAEQFTARRPR